MSFFRSRLRASFPESTRLVAARFTRTHLGKYHEYLNTRSRSGSLVFLNREIAIQTDPGRLNLFQRQFTRGTAAGRKAVLH